MDYFSAIATSSAQTTSRGSSQDAAGVRGGVREGSGNDRRAEDRTEDRFEKHLERELAPREKTTQRQQAAHAVDQPAEKPKTTGDNAQNNKVENTPAAADTHELAKANADTSSPNVPDDNNNGNVAAGDPVLANTTETNVSDTSSGASTNTIVAQAETAGQTPDDAPDIGLTTESAPAAAPLPENDNGLLAENDNTATGQTAGPASDKTGVTQAQAQAQAQATANPTATNASSASSGNVSPDAIGASQAANSNTSPAATLAGMAGPDQIADEQIAAKTPTPEIIASAKAASDGTDQKKTGAAQTVAGAEIMAPTTEVERLKAKNGDGSIASQLANATQSGAKATSDGASTAAQAANTAGNNGSTAGNAANAAQAQNNTAGDPAQLIAKMMAGQASAIPVADTVTSSLNDDATSNPLPFATLGVGSTSSPTTDTSGVVRGYSSNGGAMVATQVGMQISKTIVEGKQEFTVRLDPAELGRVDVKLSFAGDGKVVASVSADSQQTLDLLQRDARVLDRALQSAGLQTDQNSLNFSLRQDTPQHQQQAGAQTPNGKNWQAENTDPADSADPAIIPRQWTSDRALDIRI